MTLRRLIFFFKKAFNLTKPKTAYEYASTQDFKIYHES